MYNLLQEPWLPVRWRDGSLCAVRLAKIADPNIVAIDWGRADFAISALELLIGLLATACPPRSRRDWLRRWRAPPDMDALDDAFAPVAHAFNLYGDGPRFMQDMENLQADAEPIERLLIEAPGASTVRNNTDLLVHRGQVQSLGRATAAMALFTFQTMAPAGGAGNRTGLRGGGPLTTLVIPPDEPSLWHQLWANIPVNAMPPPEASDWPRVFPWLAPTITSEGNRTVTPGTAHPLQCFWSMPRRIRLDFVTSDRPEPCGLTGTPDTVHVVSWRQRPRGANYAGWGKVHTLSPYYTIKPGAEWLPVHPQPGGIGYRHWLGLVVESADTLRVPAAGVAAWRDRTADAGGGEARLRAAGFAMDNMKARAFIESEMPLPSAKDAQVLDTMARRLVLAADQAAGLLRSCVRNALFEPGATVKPDAERLASVRERLWDGTEHAFFDALRATAVDPACAERIPAEWLARLRRIALDLFDEAAPLTPDCHKTAPRISRARRYLTFALHGYTKDGRSLLETLGLPAVQPAAKQRKAS